MTERMGEVYDRVLDPFDPDDAMQDDTPLEGKEATPRTPRTENQGNTKGREPSTGRSRSDRWEVFQEKKMPHEGAGVCQAH